MLSFIKPKSNDILRTVGSLYRERRVRKLLAGAAAYTRELLEATPTALPPGAGRSR